MRIRTLASALALLFGIGLGLAPGSAARPPGGANVPSNDQLIPVGTAQTEITPSEPIRLAGYGSREHESEGVVQPLHAKALAIGSDGSGPVLLITTDLIGVSSALTERLAQRLAHRASLERERLTLTVTHTHTGPMVSGVLPYIFGEPIPPSHQKRIDAYTSRLLDELEKLAVEALAARRPAVLAWGRGSAGFAVNRRVVEEGRWTGFGIDPDGAVDLDLPVLVARSPEGNLRAVLLSYACHNTTLGPDFNRIHGDWAGEAQSLIAERHPEATVLVATGAGGDANPQPRGELSHVHIHGRTIAAEVEHLIEDGLRPLGDPPTARLRTIDLPLRNVPSREELRERAKREGAEGLYAASLLDSLEPGEPVPDRIADYPVQVWTFGDELAMIFLGGEVVADYALRLERELAEKRIWVSAYANAVPGYVASERMIAEGGYEVVESMHFYGIPAPLDPAVEDQIVRTVRELIPDSYRSGR